MESNAVTLLLLAQNYNLMPMLSEPVIHIRDLSFQPLFSEQEVQQRVQELGAALTQSHARKNPLPCLRWSDISRAIRQPRLILSGFHHDDGANHA